MRCPHCHSNNTKRSVAVFDQGRSSSTSSGGGISVNSRGSIGAHQGRFGSERISEVAKKNAPPSSAAADSATGAFLIGVAATAILIFLTGALAVLMLGLLATLVASIIVAVTVKEDGRAETYLRQWYCFKCGRNFHEPEIEVGSERGNPSDNPNPQAFKYLPSASRYPDYAERVKNPIQKARAQTDRDTQGLLDIQRRSEEDGTFDPMRPTPLDLGIVSRLASLSLISWDEATDSFRVIDASIADQSSDGNDTVGVN